MLDSQSSYTCPTPRLGVVLPLANEEQTIDELLRRIAVQLADADRIFCVMDRVSTDTTRQRIERAAEADQRIELVWAPQNRCVVDAYFSGYRAALAAGCRWILEMDGGLSHLPEQIPQFIAAMEAGYDYAPGSRFIRGGRFVGKFSRWAVSKGGTMLSNLLLGTHMKDMCSGFECFTHEALSHVVDRGVRSRANFFQTEIRFMLRDWRWKEMPITYHGPPKAVANSTIKEALWTLWALRKQSKTAPSSRPAHHQAAEPESICAVAER
jgi:dolichol-phosphate mannosyltransferase